MRAPILLLALLAVPTAAACSVAMPPSWGSMAVTGEGAVVGNLRHELGELWLANRTFRPLVALSPFGDHAVSPDGRWAAVERATGFDAMCRVHGWRFEVVDVRRGVATDLGMDDVVAFAASPRHLALTRAGADAIDVLDWETQAAVARLRLDPAAHGVQVYGEGWRANRTELLAFSPSGRLLAAYAGSDGGLVVFDVDAGAPLRADAPPYGLPSGDALVALAFSPDESHLAAATTQQGRFGEVFTWNLSAEGTAVVALRRFPEEARGLAWTDAGLVGSFQAQGWPPGSAQVAVLRRWPHPDFTGEHEARHPGATTGGGIAGRGGALYVGLDHEVAILDARTLAPFAGPERGSTANEPPSTVTHGDPPPPDGTNDVPASLALTLWGILAAARAFRGGRR